MRGASGGVRAFAATLSSLAAIGVLAGGVCAAAASGSPTAQGPTVSVSLRASDGVPIACTVYLPSRRPAASVILLHMLSRSREDWHALGEGLAGAGFVAVAVDLRGHGSSGSGADASGNLSSSQRDVAAARAYLKDHPEISTDRIGIAGASVGANLAVLAAAGDQTVRSLALLSAGLDYRGLRIEAAMKKYDRAALVVASHEDPYALRSARVLAVAGNGLRELRLLEGAGHGTVMLARQPDLVGALVDWFRRTLL